MARIELDGVTVALPEPHRAKAILGPVTASLTEQRIALIGPNGSGKSTFARLLNGLTQPSSGSVLIDGLNTRKHSAAVRRRVGFLFSDPAAQLVMPTAAEDVALSLRRRKLSKNERRMEAHAWLARFGLDHLADVSVHSLSGGQRQLLALTAALAAEPNVLIADEPTTLLDLRNTRRIGDYLFSLPQQLVIVTHDLELASRCDRALVIDSGTIVFDGPARAATDYYQAVVA
ncbi:energy-coupling factor ABC transporter ATP-binding protein [Hoyosella altamirensis]|uniref:Biotin transport system ATP-binding protein n=1 Tax=Hoyosella altamirensis TaxID=616997 RepID=A0A839RLF0_9ACTN|nr:ABC transporter ATP-binding protein [Hoyosella altamirensis]MBB3036883.1 biotin transport system ATP-binding protein [Hoyosella altamirensis]